MIYLLDKDPRRCAQYHADGDLIPALKKALKILKGYKDGKWGRWVHRRSQNYIWFFKFTEELVNQMEDRNIGNAHFLFKVGLSLLWQEVLFPPCSPRGLKSKFPKYGKSIQSRSLSGNVHQWRKSYNETHSNSKWSGKSGEPFWYYGNID